MSNATTSNAIGHQGHRPRDASCWDSVAGSVMSQMLHVSDPTPLRDHWAQRTQMIQSAAKFAAAGWSANTPNSRFVKNADWVNSVTAKAGVSNFLFGTNPHKDD